MAIIEQKGLKGLPGLPSLKDLDENALQEWYGLNPKSANRTFEQNDIIYRNQKYIEKYGKEKFYSKSLDERDTQYLNDLMFETFNERYAGDMSDFYKAEGDKIQSPEAMKYILENDFQTTKERELAKQQAEESILKGQQTYGAFVGNMGFAAQNIQNRVDYNTIDKRNKDILDKAFEIDNNTVRDREDVQQAKSQYTDVMLNELQDQGGENIRTRFHDMLNTRDSETGTPLFPFYQAYKDEHQVADISLYDMIDYLSQYDAIMETASKAKSEEERSALMSKAFSILSDDIQHAIYENTTVGDNLKNVGNGIATKFCSNLGLTCTGVYSLGLYLTDRDAYEHFIMGQNKDGSAVEGWFNPQFLSGMDQYGVWTTADYNEVLNNGGISSKQIIRDVGDEYEFWNAATLYDSMGQLGYAAANIGLDLFLTGGVGAMMKGAGKASLNTLLRAGVNPRTLVKAKNIVDNPFTDYMTDMVRIGLHSTGEATMEGVSVASEVYYDALRQYSEYFDLPDMVAKREALVEQRMQQEFPEGYQDSFIMHNGTLTSKKFLREQQIRQEVAKQMYNEGFKQAEEYALKAAGAAYATQATVMGVKNSIGDALITSYTFAKPFKTKIRQRGTVDVDKTDVLPDGTLKAKDFTWKNFAKTSAKVFAQGAAEEFTDNMVHTGAVDLGLNYYNNYLQHLYNGEDIATANLMEGATIAYLTGAEKSFYDDGAYFEAMLGAISPVTNTVLNVAAPFKFASKNYREKFTKMSTLEKANEFFLYNPLVKEAMSVQQEYDANKQVVEAVNKVISEHGQDFKDIATSMNFIREFNEMRSQAEAVDAKDSKFNLGYQFLQNLNTLAQAGEASPLYQKYLQMLSDASEGKISQEMLAQYFAMPENKVLLQGTNKEQAYKDAAAQIQKNAQQLIELNKEYQRTSKAIADFSNNTLDKESLNQLTYQTMLSSNWESRIKDMEKTLTGRSSTSTSSGKTGQMSIAGIKSILSELQGKENSINLTSKGKPKGRLKSILAKSKKISEVYQNMLKNNEQGEILSAEEIINLNPEERNRMLSHHDLYTKEQIEQIEKAENILAQRDPDYRSKIRDIATLQSRIEQNNESYKILLENPQRLMDYKNALMLQAFNDAVITKNRIAVHDMLKNLDKAYNAKDGSFVQQAKNLSSGSLKTVLESRPQYADVLKPLMERAIAMETLNSIVDGLEVQGAQKSALKNTLVNITDNATNEQEVIDAIEDFIDNSNMELTIREQLNEILDLAKDRSLVRNAVKVEKRGDRLDKERKIRDKKDERNRKDRERRAKKKAEKEALEKQEHAQKETKQEIDKEEPVAKQEDNQLEIPFNEETGEALSPRITNNGLLNTGDSGDSSIADQEIPPTIEATQLRGNVFSPYVVGNSEKDEEGLQTGKIISTTPRGAWLKAFFDWMKNAGIKYQDIIDFELAQIAALNPTVHYLMPNPNIESTNDKVFVQNPILVVEATEEIKAIHKEERGSYLRADGKDYLVIGVLGYQPGTSEESAMKELLKPLMGRRNDFFKKNPQERFTVDTKYTTTIKQIALGNLIRQLEGEPVTNRSISELLNDPKRNPYGLKWSDLSFGLQTDSGFGLSREVKGQAYYPTRGQQNSGNIFIMVPASNGRFIPVAIKPAYMSDLKTSALKDTIQNLCMQLTSSDYQERRNAIGQLQFLLYLTQDDNILIGTENLNKLSIKENGVIVHEFDLNATDLDRQAIFNTLINSRFRIQITSNNLQDVDKMKELDEAGVLQTDIAVLGTMGSHFTVNMSDLKTGKPIELQPQGAPQTGAIKGNSVRNTGEQSQLLNGRRVSKHNGIWRDEFDNPITDENQLRQIDYLNTIQEHSLQPAYKDAQGNNVYIISEDPNNSIVVKVNLSHRVQILEGEAAKPSIKLVEEQKRKAEVENAKLKDINAWLSEDVQQPTKQTSSSQQQQPQSVKEKDTKSEEKDNKTESFSEVKREKSLKDLHNSNNLLTFVSVLTDSNIGEYVVDQLEVIFNEKGWGEMPDSFNEIDSVLQSKDIPAPTNLDNIDSWLDLIKNCR